MNLLLLLEMASAVDPGRMAFRSGDAELTAGQLSELCHNIGAALGKGGFTYLAYGATNSLAFPVAVFAAAAAGIPLVPMNYRLSEDRRDATLARHAGALVVAEESQLPSLLAAGHKAVSPDRFLNMGAVTADKVPEPCPEDIAVLLYTSGTTSEPKAVVLRHRHLTR